jgi:hypothetical protein
MECFVLREKQDKRFLQSSSKEKVLGNPLEAYWPAGSQLKSNRLDL